MDPDVKYKNHLWETLYSHLEAQLNNITSYQDAVHHVEKTYHEIPHLTFSHETDMFSVMTTFQSQTYAVVDLYKLDHDEATAFMFAITPPTVSIPIKRQIALAQELIQQLTQK